MSAGVSASPAVRGSSPLDKVRALQHTLYRTAKADPGRRFHALMDKVLRRDVLWRGWAAVRAGNGAPGTGRTTLGQAGEYGVLRLLGELAEGRYRPLPARGVMIPEPGRPDEYRPLAISAVRDRIVQAALKIVLDGHSAARFGKIRNYAAERLAIFTGKRHKRGRCYGLSVVACQSASHFGLISMSGIVVPPRADKPWREKPNTGGERRR